MRNIINALLGAGDSDSVTRRIRRSLQQLRRRPVVVRSRNRVFEWLGGSANTTIRQLALRRSRQ